MRNILKLGLFLLIVAGLAGFGIGYVNNITSPLIATQERENKIKSFKEVYPQAQEVKDETDKYVAEKEGSIISEVNTAYVESKPAGVIYTVVPSGYNGKVTTMVGFDIGSKKITAIKVLSHTETPGLGAKASESSFADRFKGKSASNPIGVVKQEPVKDDEVIAITAATITSKAVAAGVNAAREHFMEHFAQ